MIPNKSDTLPCHTSNGYIPKSNSILNLDYL